MNNMVQMSFEDLCDKGQPVYACLDLETGGLDEKTCGLASVAVIRLDENLNEVDRHYFLMYESDKKYEPDALRVNGLTLDQLKSEGFRPVQFIPLLHSLCDGMIMVNHNSAFDVKWLVARGFDIKESCDTMVMRMELYPYKRAKLFMACADEGVKLENAHDALADTEATVNLFKKYVAKKPEYAHPKTIDFDRFKR